MYSTSIALTITAIVADVSDVYEERIKGDQYEYEGKWYPLKIREETIHIKGHKSKTIKIRETRHGPILSEHSE